ncbi:unnamed protein product, partial [Brassica rapa]
LCVLNRQPTWGNITRTVHGKGQRAESEDQRADMCTDGQPQMSSTYVLCVLTDTHGRPVCADGHPQTSWPTWAKITRTVHGKGQHAESKDQCADMCTDGQPRTSYSPRGPKSPKQPMGRVSVLSPRTNVLICVRMDSHRRPLCGDGHTRTATDDLCVLTDTHGHTRTAMDVLCPLMPTWAKITRTVHGKGQHAESKDQCADMCTDGQPRTSYSPRGPISPEQSTGRASILIYVLMDSHRHPLCADGHTRTHTASHEQPVRSCVLTDTHRRPVQPTWAKITQTVHGKGQLPESKDQRADMCIDEQPHMTFHMKGVSVLSPRTNVLICVLIDSHGRPVCADRHTQTHTDVLCVLNRQPTWAKITQTVHGKGQRPESKDQRADMCTDEQPWTTCVC